MNSVKVGIKKLVVGLTSVGMFFFLMFPANLYASHYRYGTMSWENPWDNGTIRLKMQNGWRTGYNSALNSVGTITTGWVSINWGDGSAAQSVQIKNIAVDSSEGSTLTDIGSNSTGTWETGVYHTYTDNGTYVVSWTSTARIDDIENMSNNADWRLETKVNIGGSYAGNVSPVSAVPPIVQIQDNTTFYYQVVATDANNDPLGYRWGTYKEFVDNTSNNTYSKPTGMTLSTSGLVTWNVQDSGGQATSENDMWLSFIMAEDLDNSSGDNKSYVPLDFFFKIASASNAAPVIIGIDNTTQTVSIGTTNTFTFTSTDDSGVAPTLSVLNPPSDLSSIWSTSSSTSGGTTTFTITFTPPCTFGNKSYAINIRSTDSAGMTKDQTLGLFVSTANNADPTAPTLVSPPNGATVTKPVSFQWTKSTDADNDAVSYSLYLCEDSGFSGCSGTNVAVGGNLMPPFNQNLQDSLISWPRYLEAAPIYQQISKDLSIMPRWLIMLITFGLLGSLISFLLKNISHRKLVIMVILLVSLFSLNINSCAKSDNTTSETSASSNDNNDDSSTSASATVTINDITHTSSDMKNSTNYYWKVIASDTKDCTTESATWSLTVQ